MNQTFLKSALLLLTGGVAGQVFGLGRNILIARTLGPEIYGVGAALLVGVSMIELIADVSIEKVLVQAKSGGERRFLAAAHTLACFRAVIVAMVLLFTAPLVAWLLDFSEHVNLFRCLAVLPLISAWRNLELNQRQRLGQFRPVVLNNLYAQIISTAAAFPLVMYLKSPVAVLLVGGIGSVASVVGSHLLARERFRLGWNRKHFETIIRFGIPLLLNGSILFLSLQGDRVVVLRGFGPVGFAILSVALTLISVPINLTAKILGDLLFPRFSGMESGTQAFLPAAKAALLVYSFIGAFAVVGFVFFGPYAISIYGSDYRSALDFLPLLGVAGAIRLVRAGQAMIGFSVGSTGIALVTGLARTTGLMGSIVAIEAGGSIADVAIAMIGGEIVSLVTGAIYLHRRIRLNPMGMIGGLVIIFSCFSIATACEQLSLPVRCTLIVSIGLLFLVRASMYYRFFRKTASGSLPGIPFEAPVQSEE